MPKLYKDRKGSRKNNVTFSRKSNISKRKPRNRHQMKKKNENVGTSSEKLKKARKNYDINVEHTFGYRILCFFSVFSALSETLVCKTCLQPVKFTESCNKGLGFKLVVSCKNCSPVLINSCPLINGKSWEINRRIILVMRLLGIGLNGLQKFCALLDLPHPVYQKSYDSIVKVISIVVEKVSLQSMKNAAKEEVKINVEEGETGGITVSGDGSWRKREFTSLYGIMSLIDKKSR